MVPAGRPFLRREVVMGTGLEFRIHADRERAETAAAGALEWLRWVDDTFSLYKPGSEMSRLSRGEVLAADCHPEVQRVIEACEAAKAATGGAFDAHATGCLDPSGYVKGWAVERASDRLVAAGCPDHYIECGGDVRLRGRPGDADQWHVGIRHPVEHSALCAVVRLAEGAVATSGTYERGLHVADPHRQKPAEHWVSVTVVGPDLTTTDVYATAMMAMGPDAPAWIERRDGFESLMVDHFGRPWRSSGFGYYEVPVLAKSEPRR